MVRARFINDVTVIDVTSESEVKRVKLNLQEDHARLINRDMADQHPISAISGLETALLEKQDALTAGENIQIENGVISATDTTYTAGTGISIENGVISNTQTSAEWGNVGGTLSNQTDLQNALNDLSGGIDSNHQAISSINQTISTYGNIVTHNTSEFATSSQGALADTAVQPNDNISELNNNVGYITGVTSSDVTTALGYTPYNATNPNGYQANVIETVKVNNTALTPTNKEVNITVPTQASDINALPNTTKYGASVILSLSTTDYKMTLTLKDQDGNTLGTSQTIDFPIESVVVGGSYDAINKKVVLTLQNGSTIEFSVADLVSGLQTEITSSNKLDADLVDDSTSVNKFVTASDKTTWNNKQDAISDLVTIRSGASAGATALQPNDNISELVNNAGYITGITSTDVTTALGYTPIETIATGSTNGTISVDGTDVSVYGLGSAAYTASTDYATSAQGAKADTAVQPADLTNYVTTNTDQDITGIKTYVGAKRIKFKQSSVGNKLGFTLYNNNNKEAASFEYITSAIDGYPLMYLGQYIGSNSVSYVTTPVYVGFRYYDYYSQAAYQLVAPLAKDAKTPFNLDIYHKTFYLPLGVTDGNTTVTTPSTGLLDISSILPTVNDATLTITQGGVSKGTFTANASSDVTIDLDAGGGTTYTAGTGINITNNVISVASPTLTNTADAINSLVILGNETGGLFKYGITCIGYDSYVATTGTAVGYSCYAGNNGVALGVQASCQSSTYSIAIGFQAIVSGSIQYAIQLGQGTNSEANSFYVSTSASNNWKMLGSDGKIPSGRLPIATSVSSSSTNDQTVGAKLFYDTCGDIETLINAL